MNRGLESLQARLHRSPRERERVMAAKKIQPKKPGTTARAKGSKTESKVTARKMATVRPGHRKTMRAHRKTSGSRPGH